MSNKSIGDRILKASAAVFVAHLAFKFVGFIQFFIVGSIIETTAWECVYGFAFDGVVFSLFLIGEELIGPALLPIFAAEKEKHGETAAWQIANTLLTVQIVILGLVVLTLTVFPAEITKLLTYWSEDEDTERFRIAVTAVRLMAPALIGFSIGSTTYMLLNGYKKFFLAAFADAVWKICILVGVAVGVGLFGMGWRALVIGVVIGSVAKLLTHCLGLLKQLHFVRPSLAVNNPAFKSMLWLMLPLLVGIVFAKGRDFYNQVTVLSALDASGLIKANAYGRKLFQALGMVVPYTLSIAMFPYFCDLVAKDDKKRLGEILTKSGRMLLVFFVPIAMVFTVYSHELVKLLVFGKFSAEDAHLAGISMACYTLVLPAYGMEMLLMQAYFANRKMFSSTAIGISFSALSILISYLGIIQFGAKGVIALAVVALGYVLSRSLKSMCLLGLLKRSIPLFELGETIVFMVKLLIIGALATGAVYGVFVGLDFAVSGGHARLLMITKLAVGGIAAGLIYLGGVIILRIREPFEMLDWAKQKVKGKVKGKWSLADSVDHED